MQDLYYGILHLVSLHHYHHSPWSSLITHKQINLYNWRVDNSFNLARSFFLFLMISRRQIISRSAGPIFAIFTSNESFLAVDDRSGPIYSISQGTLPWQPILCKKWQTPHFRRPGIQTRYGISLGQWAR